MADTIVAKRGYVCSKCGKWFTSEVKDIVKCDCGAAAYFETANQAFCRLANMRMPKALHQLKLIENLFTGVQYQFTEPQGKQIVEALSDVLCRISDKADGKTQPTKLEGFHIEALPIEKP